MIYTTADGAKVKEGDLVYDYYSMEPIIIGGPNGSTGWFDTLRADGSGVRSSAGMLDGSRICTLSNARRQGFPGAEEVG